MVKNILFGTIFIVLLNGCSSKYTLENNNVYGKSMEANHILKSYKDYQVNLEFSEQKVKSSYLPYQQLKVQNDELVGIIKNNPSVYKRIGLNSFEIQADEKSIKPIQCVNDNDLYSNYPSEKLLCKFKKSDFGKENISNLTLIINTMVESKTKNIPLDYNRQVCIEESKFSRVDIQECIKLKTQNFINSQINVSLRGEIKETYSINSSSEDDKNFVKVYNSFVSCLQSSTNECKNSSF